MLVYLRDDVQRSDLLSRKLSAQWIGPYEITKVVSPHTVRLRELLTQKNLVTDVHIDRLKRCWSERSSFFAQPSIKAELHRIECILQQKGQTENPQFLIRYETADDGSRPLDKWVRAHDVPESIVSEWRKTHCKNGELRKRQMRSAEKEILTDTEIQDTASDTDDENTEAENMIKTTQKVKHESDDNKIRGTRRSLRNLARVNYQELDSRGFVD